jgi:hypothetical protein
VWLPRASKNLLLARCCCSRRAPICNGKQIARAQAVAGAAEETDNIWMANADGSRQRQLTHERTGVASHHPTWSPDGGSIAFMSTREAGTDGASIWQINTNGRGLRQLTHARFEDADPLGNRDHAKHLQATDSRVQRSRAATRRA